jgi:hypothetical protein
MDQLCRRVGSSVNFKPLIVLNALVRLPWVYRSRSVPVGASHFPPGQWMHQCIT